MIEININEGDYQDIFLNSDEKFPLFCGGVGVGKTLLLLLKVYRYLERWDGSTGLIIRKEYTSLRDSTIADFQKLFGVSVGVDKNFKLNNNSILMFRHGDEMPVIKNLSASIIGIEQLDEFSTDETFQMCRDRLRQNNGAPVTPLISVANSNGHSWYWKQWINNAKEIKVIDKETNQIEYKNGPYHAITASSFANKANLRPDFIEDLKRKEIEAPAFYRRYILNSWEEDAGDDLVFPLNELSIARKAEYALRPGYGTRILACDPARFGNDMTSCVIIQQMGALHWEQIHLEEWQGKDAVYTVGRCNEIAAKHRVDSIVIDEDGLGGPIGDFIRASSQQDITGFRNITYSFEQNKFYGNARSEAAFKTKEMIAKGWLKINDEKIYQELNGSFYFKYTTKGQKILISKDALRSDGISSPNAGDSLCYTVSMVEEVQRKQQRQYAPIHASRGLDNWSPFKSDDWNPFSR